MHPILRLALPVIATVLLVACDSEEPKPTPTPSPTASVIATAPLPPIASATATASPTATATQTPTAFPTGPAGPTPPAGYASSCAGTHPWGRQVTVAFVCIEQPTRGASVARGTTLTVRGYAGGSFENNVVVEVRLVNASGVLAGSTLAHMPVTYVAPDMGMPGFWQAVLTIPAGQPSNARVIAHFESPKDGARVAEASVDIALK
ncbi:MAG: hypothetical protein DWI58_15930 [Chloroflexi bacterium]|nr:MAG: hypothetical protein DWI58_15930 [Chloroflexota bacterium]